MTLGICYNTNMQFVCADTFDFSRLQAFVEPWESSCVTLCSFIRKKKENLYVLCDKLDSGTTLHGILYLDKTLLYCIPNPEALPDLLPSLTVFLKDKTVSCLNGEAAAGEIILEALKCMNREPYQTNHYNIMTIDTQPMPPPEELSCDDEIKRCADPVNETELLLPLQKMYMAKEVAPQGKQITDLEASAQLKSILKDQLCFALYSDGEIVSKANTNAIGFNYVQLGGVYTHPLYRKNYYAWHLVYTICQRVLKTGRKLSLFVKEKNNPAIMLYKRIGFVETETYMIGYFK